MNDPSTPLEETPPSPTEALLRLIHHNLRHEVKQYPPWDTLTTLTGNGFTFSEISALLHLELDALHEHTRRLLSNETNPNVQTWKAMQVSGVPRLHILDMVSQHRKGLEDSEFRDSEETHTALREIARYAAALA